MIVTGTGGRIQDPGRELYLGNNGTAMRFLVSIAALGSGDITPDGGSPPLRDPAAAARGDPEPRGSVPAGTPAGFPLSPSTAARFGGRVIFRDIESSQYVSSILIAAPYAAGDGESRSTAPPCRAPMWR